MWRTLVFVGVLILVQLVPRPAHADLAAERILVVSEYAEHPALIEYYDSVRGWIPVCVSPCAALIVPTTRLRTRSKNTTTEFAIEAHAGERVDLPIRDAVLRGERRGRGRALGIVGIVLGSVALAASVFLAAAASNDGLRSEESGEDYAIAAAGTFFGGGGLLAGGLVELVLSRRPSTSYQTVTPRAPVPAAPENINGTTVHAPASVTMPLLSVSF
ncbi:hypothetical protein LZC95_48405 [Pendulispora brunnea]|uniref:Uncharacterized protein n=1 Tax=Pendulispora brunnea TaxID=2905690 RepID=A0ABZ2K6E4_9BACT